jgi:TRAP-type C4-dicarboxylate transport system permease small subunit
VAQTCGKVEDMKRLLKQIAGLIDGLAEITGLICGLAILAAAIIITLGVLLRQLWTANTVFEKDVSSYLLILSVFVGAAYTHKHKGHIGVDVITTYLSHKSRATIDLAGEILGFLVAVVIARYAWPIWWEVTRLNQHSGLSANLPLAIPYIIIPLGMSLLALVYLVHIPRKIALLGEMKSPNNTNSSEILPDADLPIAKKG